MTVRSITSRRRCVNPFALFLASISLFLLASGDQRSFCFVTGSVPTTSPPKSGPTKNGGLFQGVLRQLSAYRDQLFNEPNAAVLIDGPVPPGKAQAQYRHTLTV